MLLKVKWKPSERESGYEQKEAGPTGREIHAPRIGRAMFN